VVVVVAEGNTVNKLKIYLYVFSVIHDEEIMKYYIARGGCCQRRSACSTSLCGGPGTGAL